MVTIYHTELGYTLYLQRLPTFTSWFSESRANIVIEI